MMQNRDKVIQLIHTLSLLVGGGIDNFVYRGESKCFDTVSSSLYRQLYELSSDHFDIGEAEQRQLDHAKQFTKETDKLAILAEIQHRGGNTNLIDFTTDLNIALFFACKFSQDKDGRVILLSRYNSANYTIRRAVQPSNMADAQKSMFVISKQGYIKDKDVTIYTIPRELKADVVHYLDVMYGISMPTVYNDISGFIRHQDEFKDYEAEFYAGRRSLVDSNLSEAITHFTNYLEHPETYLRSGLVYYLRGIAYSQAGDMEKALEDFIKYDSRNWDSKPDLPAELRKIVEAEKKTREQKMELERRKDEKKSQGTQGSQKDVLYRIHLESRDVHGTPVAGTRFQLQVETGFGYSHTIPEDGLPVTVPTVCFGIKLFFWFNKDGYNGFNPMEHEGFDPTKDGAEKSFETTLKPKKRNQHLPEVIVKVTYRMDEVAE